MRVKGEHEIYCCGARVRISEKDIEVLSEPLIDHCPLMKLCTELDKLILKLCIRLWK